MCVVVPICGFGEYPQRDTFKESLKALEADIQHANTLMAGDMMRDYDGAYLQMRLGFSPLAPLVLFLVRWTDCSLAGALGLLRVLVFKVHKNGRTTAARHERKASLNELYGFLYPSLLQLYPGISDVEHAKQQRRCNEHYLWPRMDADLSRPPSSSSTASPISSSSSWPSPASSSSSSCSSYNEDEEIELMGGMEREKERARDREREGECGICLEEIRSDGCDRVAIPSCAHSMCSRCFKDWSSRSRSCPFCRDELGKVQESDLWVVVGEDESEDMRKITRDNLRRIFLFVHRLPVMVTDALLPPLDLDYYSLL
ncbi:hypothetical protein CLOM_g7659 [Closterium sp. NIES-68]|nr:hypothetical protein CLOM_g7659 [Closterium sp. NIES-68]GJP65871.1 hypothetical protein CLOP_g22778 [Closterium sp. NIES-67]